MKETIKIQNLNRAERIRERIISLTGFTDEQLNQMMFSIAEDYMRGLGMYDEWLSLWMREPLFWSWWRQQWTLIDEVYWHKYVINHGREDVKTELQKRYEKLHRAIDKFPDEIVYNKIHDSYWIAEKKILQKIKNSNS